MTKIQWIETLLTRCRKVMGFHRVSHLYWVWIYSTVQYFRFQIYRVLTSTMVPVLLWWKLMAVHSSLNVAENTVGVRFYQSKSLRTSYTFFICYLFVLVQRWNNCTFLITCNLILEAWNWKIVFLYAVRAQCRDGSSFMTETIMKLLAVIYLFIFLWSYMFSSVTSLTLYQCCHITRWFLLVLVRVCLYDNVT